MPKPASEPVAPATIASLLDKGDGTLVKRGSVWSYPAAPNDRSGTNLQVPVEFVSDAAVQGAIRSGDLVPRMCDSQGVATAVGRPAAADAPVRVVSMVQAGSVEAATELPPNSRPTHDAGRNDSTVDAAMAQAAIEAQRPAPLPIASSTSAAPAVAGPALVPAAAPAAPAPAAKP